MKKPIYLDYNATTPHDPEVIDAMRPFLEEEFGNPSSSHWYGTKPKKAVMEARSRVASLLNCEAEEIIFTSGGTESNNHAILGMTHLTLNKTLDPKTHENLETIHTAANSLMALVNDILDITKIEEGQLLLEE